MRAGHLGIVALLILVGVLLLLYSCAGGPVSEGQANLNPKQADPELLRMLQDELERQLSKLPPRQTSAPPMRFASKAVLTLSDNTQLDWRYYSQGDYDQNGEVNVADLTPLAIHFQESVVPATFAPNSIQAVIDGDGNGEINLADVTPIAINFQNTVNTLNVYRSLDHTDYPRNDPLKGNGQAEGILQIPLSKAVGDPLRTRLAFSAVVPEQREGDWLWIRPKDASTEGIASNIVGPVLDPGYTIQGRIVDPHSTVPSLDGLVINLEGTGFSTLTDSEGNFEFSGVPAGGYTVAPFSFELYFEPVQLETTVVEDDIDIADISAFNINTAHTYGFDIVLASRDAAATNLGEVLLSGSDSSYPNDSHITLLKYGLDHELVWAKVWDNAAPNFSPSVASLTNGSFLMACPTVLTFLEEQHSFFSIVKFNSNGELSWQRKWGSLDRDVTRDAVFMEPALDGDIYIFSLLETGDIQPEGKALLIKLSPSSVVRWQQTLHVPESQSGAIYDVVGGPGGMLHALASSSLADFLGSFYWFAEIDGEGNIVWAKKWSVVNERLSHLVELSSGNLLAVGRTEMYADDTKAGLLVEITPGGDLVSAKKWETDSPSSLSGCVQTPKGGLVGAGNVGTIPFSRPLLFYINPDGELDWSMVWVSEHPASVNNLILDANNNAVLSGSGKNNQGTWVPIDGQLETIPGALEDITLETAVPGGVMSPHSGTMSPLDGVEDVGSGERDMLVIWRHISE